MKIVLASTSAVKIAACRDAFGAAAEIVTFKASSGVNEQPVGDETLTGAFNRIAAAKKAIPGADLYVAIENGIFEEKGGYVDRPVVAVAREQGAAEVTYGEGVIFPTESVEETRRRGFDAWTVGKVMEEQGIVRQHDDPHKDLSGISRADYITAAARVAAARLS